jgi:hypothetical protein
MCQISKTNTLVLLEEDMVVWKVMMPEGGLLLSSFHYEPYEYGELKKVNVEEIVADITENQVGSFQIYFGLHSFLNKEDAQAFADFYFEKVVKAIIPKGSFIIEGIFDSAEFPKLPKYPVCIVSDQLMLVRE